MKTPAFRHSIIAVLLLPAAVSAQSVPENSPETTTASELETIEVNTKNRSTRTENRDSYTTSAMRTTTGLALSPRETPQSVSVITRTQLEDQGISSLPDALKTTTGVNVSRDGGRWRLESRGFQMNKIEEDGIATTVAAGNNGNPYRDAQGLSDLAIYDHIEVVRGATGLTQGQGTPGGTVNAVRKKPTSQRRIQGEISLDRWGSVRGVADISGSLNSAQTLRGRLVGAISNQESFKDRIDSQTYMLYGVMDAQIGDRGMLTWGAMYQRTGDTPDITGLPMGLNNIDSGLPRSTYLGFDWNKQRQTKINLFGEYEHHFNDNWRLNSKINYTRNRLDYRLSALGNSSTAYPGLVRGGTLAPNNLTRYNNSGFQLGFQTNLNGTYRLFGREHDLFAGYAYSYESNDSHRRQFRENQTFDPFAFRGNEIGEPDWNAPRPICLT